MVQSNCTGACVAVGSLNPGILGDPNWLKAQGVIDTTAEVSFQFDPTLLGPPRMSLEGLTWLCTPSHLTVDTATPDKINAGQYIKKALEKLCHTPVTGVGNNFHFRYPSPAPFTRFSSAADELLGDELLASSQRFKIDRRGAQLVVTVHRRSGELQGVHQVDFNYHRAVAGASAGAAAAARWLEDKADTQGILTRLDLA